MILVINDKLVHSFTELRKFKHSHHDKLIKSIQI